MSQNNQFALDLFDGDIAGYSKRPIQKTTRYSWMDIESLNII